MINKKRTRLYLNVFDGVYVSCVVLNFLFFSDSAINIIVMWCAFFLCTGLALRRYCKGKAMIRFGTSSEVDDGDEREVVSSYNYHLSALILGVILVVGVTIKNFYNMYI